MLCCCCGETGLITNRMNGQMVTARVIYMIEYGTVKNILKFLPFCKEYKEREYLKKCPASHQQLICFCFCLCFFISLKFSALEVSCLEFKKVAAISKYFFLFRSPYPK